MIPGSFSILAALSEIDDFIKHCMRDPDFVGLNVVVIPKGGSALLGKCNDSFKAKYVFHTPLDYANPVEIAMINNQIHKSMHGKDASPESLERAMVDKTEEH